MRPIKLKKIILLSFLLCLALPGCYSGQQLILDKATGLFKEIALSANRQSDVSLVRQGLPSYLLMIDGLIQSFPEDPDIHLAGAQAYAFYASLLDETESSRAAQNIHRAKIYALKSLHLTPLFKGVLDGSLDRFQEALQKTDQTHVSLLFMAGSIWGTWIAQGPDPVEGMADLSKVEAIMDKVLQLDPGIYYGGPHLFKGILLSARPVQFGGDLKKADSHFKQALAYSKDKFLMTSVYYAQYYAKQRLDRELFVATLNKVLSIPVDSEPDLTLSNTLAHQKAKKLLSQVDEFF
jgi:tetratricopeptide (TPR) repeat protein